MAQKTILITGCSSGIGRDAALALHARGWRVFAACRRGEDCEPLCDAGLESLALDYADPASVAAAAEQVLAQTGGRLDALFNNGAHATPGAVEDVPREALEAIFQANLFGPHDLTRRVLPAMRTQGHGRIVNCSSVLGLVAAPWRGAYNATKFALEGLTDTLRLEMRGTPIHVVLIEPGPIATPFRRKSVPHFERWIDWERSARAEDYRTRLIPRLTDETPSRSQRPPAAVTGALIRALESPRPRPRYFVTPQTHAASVLRRILPARALDAVLARM